MIKAEWEKKHGYRKSEHNCGFCRHCIATEIDPWTYKYSCEEKIRAGVGGTTKLSADCDLWEHRDNAIQKN
jgi:hypothetical protein